jgi:hypothetical protein
MGLLLFLLLVAVAFTWLVVRSVRAGWGKLLFWLAWFLIGCCAALSIEIPGTPLERFLVQVWAYSLVVLPVWWAVRKLLSDKRRMG